MEHNLILIKCVKKTDISVNIINGLSTEKRDFMRTITAIINDFKQKCSSSFKSSTIFLLCNSNKIRQLENEEFHFLTPFYIKGGGAR